MYTVPQNKIQIIAFEDGIDMSNIEKLTPHREHFNKHMYKCLPMTMANQHGFVIRAPYDFNVIWDGSDRIEGLQWNISRQYSVEDIGKASITIDSTFGYGIFTFHPKFIVKTSEKIGLWVKQPPNNPKHGISWMEGVVETDNLNAPFTYNLKVTIPDQRFYFKKGEPIGCFVPYPRYFLDEFQLDFVDNENLINDYKEKHKLFDSIRSVERTYELSPERYRNGVDFNGCPFHNHQIRLKDYSTMQENTKVVQIEVRKPKE